MKRVIVESPFAGKTQAESLRNLNYLKQCLRDSLLFRGEAPFASHGLYPGALDDKIPEERKLGIEAGFEWWNQAEVIVFYVDLGWSSGMEAASERALILRKRTEIRTVDQKIGTSPEIGALP